MEENIFGRKALEELSGAERKLRLHSLQGLLVKKLSVHTSEKEFFGGMQKAKDSLRNIGHDLWSHGYDGETEVWGGDYMKPQTFGKLLISFNFEKKAIVEWNED